MAQVFVSAPEELFFAKVLLVIVLIGDEETEFVDPGEFSLEPLSLEDFHDFGANNWTFDSFRAEFVRVLFFVRVIRFSFIIRSAFMLAKVDEEVLAGWAASCSYSRKLEQLVIDVLLPMFVSPMPH